MAGLGLFAEERLEPLHGGHDLGGGNGESGYGDDAIEDIGEGGVESDKVAEREIGGGGGLGGEQVKRDHVNACHGQDRQSDGDQDEAAAHEEAVAGGLLAMGVIACPAEEGAVFGTGDADFGKADEELETFGGDIAIHAMAFAANEAPIKGGGGG